jgi:hypothetical protein
MIPKVINYCWFGPNELPKLALECIASWGSIWPDYKVVRWDESNTTDNPYIQEALRRRKYANASNLARFYAIQEGGIYLDIDIEAYKPFGSLLENQLLLGWQDSRYVNNAVMAATPKHPFVEFCITEFQKRFDASERAHISSPLFITDMLRDRYGELEPEVTRTLSNEVTLLSNDYFYPSPPKVTPKPEHMTDNTICVHYWMKNWK